jgi:hypothetical protein
MVTRKLVFNRWASINMQPQFVPNLVANGLALRTEEDANFAKLENDSDITTAVEVVDEGTDTTPSKFLLLALRQAINRPLQWEPGEPLGPLALLDSQYPADVTHVAVWPDGFAAQDFHTNAPRLGRLSYYLRHKMRAHVTFEPLYVEDMVRRLRSMRGQLRSVHIGMTKPEYAVKDNRAFAKLLPAAFGPEAPSLNVAIGMGRYGPRNRFLDQATEEAVFAVAEDAHDYVSSLIVKGVSKETGRVVTINLLAERLHVERELPASVTMTNLPDSDATFQAMEEAYKDFHAQDLLHHAVRAEAMSPS